MLMGEGRVVVLRQIRSRRHKETLLERSLKPMLLAKDCS